MSTKLRFIVMVYAAMLLFSIGYVALPQANEEATVNVTRSYGDFYVVPVEDFGYAPMLKYLIDNAESNVYVAMEVLSDNEPVKTLLDSLINAKNRGVDVRVLYESDISGNSDVATYLSNNGVTVKGDGSSKFIHSKLVVIDGSVVYIGSHNWSPTALGDNNEYGAIIYNGTIATFFQNYFTSLWNDDSATPNLNLINLQTSGYTVNTTYDGYTYNSLMSLMNSAQTRLYVAMYTMAYYSNPTGYDEERVDNLVDAIVSKKDIAQVVLDDHDSSDAYNYLSSQGVDVKYDSSSTITHLKLVIADNTVYIGDANWDTGYINNDTHTVGVVIENETLANYFASFFQKVYQYGNVPYYIPSPFVDTWETSGPAGGYATIKIHIANGGFRNSTYFSISPSGPLWMDIGRYPSWNRNSVYDWRNETLYIEIPSSASGTYTVALIFYSADRDINYTMYFQVTVSGSGGSLPISDHPVITEVYYQDGSSYTKYRFVEIYNPTSEDFDLTGYKLVNVTSGKTYTISGLKILPHSHVTIAVKSYYFAEKFYKYPDIGDGSQHNLEISSTPGGIELREPDNSTVVDAVYWGGYNGWNVDSGLYRSIVRVPYDWDNDSATQFIGYQEPKPWVQSTADKVVLIDRGHDNDYSFNLGKLVVSLRKMGLNPENFTTTTGYHSNISADLLNTSSRALAKLLIITNPNRALNSQEITNITDFINNFNGSLLLTSRSDYNNAGKPENLNPILQSIGSVIRFNDDGVYDSTNNYGSTYKVVIHNFNDTSTGITDGVSELHFYSPSSLIDSSGGKLTESEAIILATGDDDTYNQDNDNDGNTFVSYPSGSYPPVAAAQVVNEHRIAAIGATVFSDYDFDSVDNALFTQNLVKWLMDIKSVSLGTPSLKFSNSQRGDSSMIVEVSTSNANSVMINYTSDGTNYVEDSMYDDGTHGDATAGDGVYTYTIPSYSSGAHVQITITASGVDSTASQSVDYYAFPTIAWARNNTVKVAIEGQVTVKPGSFYNSIYIQNGSAGIQVYGADLSPLGLGYGDYVKVIGDVISYGGDVEVKITSASDVVFEEHGTEVQPQDITIAQANSTNYGKLVRVSGKVKSIDPNGKYFYVEDTSGNAVKIYLRNSSIDISSLSVGEDVTVTGVQAQYYSTYEILPREQSDIVVGVIPELNPAFMAILLLIVPIVLRRRD